MANIIRTIFFLFALFAHLGFAPTSHSGETIRYGIPEPNYPPYLMSDKDGQYGIVGETFIAVSKSIGHQVDILVLPGKRIRYRGKLGKLDATSNALEWETDTAGMIWTDGIIRVSANVVVIDAPHIEIIAPDELRGKSVALMRDYIYPSLESMIKDKSILVARAPKFESLFRMIVSQRVDYGVLDQNVAKWVIRENKMAFARSLHFITPGFDEVEFRILLFSKKWTPFVGKFNLALAKFKTSGGFQKILDKYR